MNGPRLSSSAAAGRDHAPAASCDPQRSETVRLHRLVYCDLLPRLKARRGIVEAERSLLRFKVLGGLGPQATADFLDELFEITPAATDREHLRLDVKIDPLMGRANNPQPVEAMQAAIDALVKDAAGPTALCIPCNTAHARIDSVRFDRRAIRFVSMVDATVEFIRSFLPRGEKVGLLATGALVASELYQRALADAGYVPLVPHAGTQALVDAAIYGGTDEGQAVRGIKGGDRGDGPTALVQRAADELVAAGAKALSLSCTELPLVFGPQRDGTVRGSVASCPVANSTRALARAYLNVALQLQEETLRAALAL